MLVDGTAAGAMIPKDADVLDVRVAAQDSKTSLVYTQQFRQMSIFKGVE
jgi:hypothetical protein